MPPLSVSGTLALSLHFKLTCTRYEKHYSLPIGRKKVAKGAEKAADDVLNKKHSKHVQAILAGRKSLAPVESKLEEQFATGRLYGKLMLNARVAIEF